MAGGHGGFDPYAVLGVPATASAEQLRRAYRRRMRETHPDLGGDPDVFELVQRAWRIVSTPSERARHDERRRAYNQRPDEPTVWTAGPSARQEQPRARSYGHPGGWSRQRYLDLIREWVGRGSRLDDPYEESLVARAPWEIRHALADAVAEEATAKALLPLGSAYTIWHDIAVPGGLDSGTGKLDHVVLGPSGLFAIQSENWLVPVQLGGRDLIVPEQRIRPMKDHARRAKVASRWRVSFTALAIVLPDEHLAEDVARVGGSRRPLRFAVRRSFLPQVITTGAFGLPGLDADVLFDWRTRLQRHITLI